LLQTVHRQAQLLINLVNELLDLSRIEARQGKDFHRQHCSVESIVRETVKGLLVKGDKRQVDLDLSFGKERILVDPEKTMQALLNVLSNAFKYSPLGGSIEVGTLLGTGERSCEVGIRVTDHGLGMSPEHQLRVFDRFFRAEPSGAIPGTGLGMSLVKEITELQEGQVQIQSELGRGTAVTLWFPVVSDFLLSRPLPGMDERL
jgi:signal transduction histidine kinase